MPAHSYAAALDWSASDLDIAQAKRVSSGDRTIPNEGIKILTGTARK
jgi:hypothetical protein